MGLQLDGRIMAGNDLLDGDLRDIEIISSGAGTFLYAATGQNGGISVYQIDTGGGLARLSDTRYFSSSGIVMGSIEMVSLDGVARLFLNGTGNGQLTGYDIKGDGDITGVKHSDLPGNGAETANALTSVMLSGGITALYMVDGDTGALAGYVSDGAGALVAQTGQGGKAAGYDIAAAVALDIGQVAGTSFLLAADAASGGVRSYRIDATTGALQYADSLGAENGLGIAAPSAMQVVSAHGATWVILAAAGSGSLSVMHLSATGQLEPADHILDTLATRFGGVAALEVIKVGGHVFVLAGGGDDGLSLFSLLPDGQLVHLQSLAHSTGAGLENVTGIRAVQVGDALQIFVTSGGDLGISQLSLPLDDLGLVIQSNGGGGGQVLGTGAGDLILGAGALDQLMGQGGDDILVAAHAGGTLSGGTGRDIFVLCPTTGSLEISDFEPGLDRLDLTRFLMLRSISQLDLQSTSTGIEIRHGTTLVVVHSFDGTPLKAADLWPAGFDTPDRVLIPPGPVIRVTRGTPAEDTLVLGPGQDRVWGLAGDDLIRGGVGADRLIGGSGADRIFGGKGGDVLKGGQGDDTLNGEDKADILFGGGGNDRLVGGRGDDILTGGAGQDVFIFGPGGGKGHGEDTITDFTSGKDHIRMTINGIGFDDLTLTRLASDTGFDTLVDTGAGTITVTELRPKDLSVDDFLFS